ncbi:MAG: hypothetical protein CVU74_06420, partial [Deltaproteobacteria bacterium HGW-Deltaproteobacteria-9]
GAVSESKLANQPLLETKLTGETGIYLTDFAYLCARVAEVRVGFERYKETSYSADGYFSDIWQVNYIWTYDYYDYIPYLLEKMMLPVSKSDTSYSEFQRALFFPEQFPDSSFDALRAMQRFPQSSLLLIEIANVLRGRQMLYEADEVLSSLLLSHPENVVARVMRMLIYSNVAEAQADFSIAAMAFERAIAEGEFVAGLGNPDTAIFSEFSALFFNRAKKWIKFLRGGNLSKERTFIQQDMFLSLIKAKELFLKALATSPTGKDTTSLFWMLYVLCYLELFSADEKLLGAAENNSLVDSNDVFKKTGIRLFTEVGWLNNEDFSDGNISESAFNNLLVILASINARHDNSMLSRSYIPYVKYLFALLLWDFTPRFTLGICNMVLLLLNEALSETEKLIADNLSVYKISVNYVAPEIFILRLQETIGVIKKLITDDDLKKGDNFPLDPVKLKEIARTKLMLLELDWD